MQWAATSPRRRPSRGRCARIGSGAWTSSWSATSLASARSSAATERARRRSASTTPRRWWRWTSIPARRCARRRTAPSASPSTSARPARPPRVGIVANGEEEGKGTDLTRAAAAALRKPESGVTFRGYVEGKDVFAGEFDVIATDGFTGNVLLKTAEGAVWAFGQLLKRQIQASAVASAGALLLRSQLDQVKKRVDYEEVGGALLLGIHGVGVIAHGRSTPRAILNALSGAEAFAAQQLEDDLTAAARCGIDLFKT